MDYCFCYLEWRLPRQFSLAVTTLLWPLIGGYVATRLEHTNGARLGALSGFGTGLVAVFTAAIASNLAPNTTVAGVLMVVVGTFGGGVGAYLTLRGQKAV